jgi:cobalamin 5'-phosphate synthase/cobalamin synthase
VTSFLAAVALLTRVPVRRTFSMSELASSPPCFPAVGALIGLGQLAVVHAVGSWLPPTVLSACLLGGSVWFTGALHLDGLADAADGFGGGQSREDTLRIMRDPSIGTFGVAAIVFTVLIRAAALSTLINRRVASLFLVLAPSLGRWTMVALAYRLPYARSEGGLGSLAARITARQLAVATAITVAVSAAAGVAALAAWIAALAVVVAGGRAAMRRLGGFTGDTLGAANEITETVVLMAAVMLTR